MILLAPQLARAESDSLAIGIAAHAFDHLGEFNDQAPAAAASGATIIYSTGFGVLGYQGLPAIAEQTATHDRMLAYLTHAKSDGIRLAIGYVCATSIVKLETFDKNWTPDFRAQFKSPPNQWLQQDKDGKPLPSWYGGNYRPACMNNPDWRTYEKYVVRQQLEAGHDGIFFDNPTVHPQGCYCEHCLRKFAQFVHEKDATVEAARKLAIDRPKDFLRFRATIASDFLADIRAYARSIKPGALITCNNSWNAPEVLFSQTQMYGYDIYELSKVEDLVVVEDMGSQPRTLASGATVEYGPMYEILQGLSRGKPMVAVTIADGDYHTPANLMRLAMAEAAAHGASYLSWPTWPKDQRARMIAAVRPEADFLRQHASLLNDVQSNPDVLVFLPHRQWVESADCPTLNTVRALAQSNIQFRVTCEDEFSKSLAANPPPTLAIESLSILNDSEAKAVDTYKSTGGHVVWTKDANWLDQAKAIAKTPAIVVHGPPAIRAVVRRQGGKTIIHLFNLNVQRLSSFEDRVTPASDVRLRICVNSVEPKSVRALTADNDAASGNIPFHLVHDNDSNFVELTLPRVVLSTILVIE
jgi:hypothetical protein